MFPMFEGFSEKTSEFFFMMGMNNSKTYLQEQQDIYNEYVKRPLRELQRELSHTIAEIDSELCTIPSRCISGIYNDVRFGNKDKPLRDYMWVRFKCMNGRDTDIPGFFFDASYDGCRYGLRVYKMTTGGMQKIRDAILSDPVKFKMLSQNLDNDRRFIIEGNEYARDHFTDYDPILKKWLNKKNFYIHCSDIPMQTYYSNSLAEEMVSGFTSLSGMYKFIKAALEAK